MTILVELDPATEARLTAEAELRGVPVAEYAGSLLRRSIPAHAAGTGKLTPEGLKELTRELTKGSDKMPILPLEVNDRESYYEDRW